MNPSEFSERIIPLHDGRPGLRSSMQVEIKEPPRSEIQDQESSIQEPEPAVLDFIASSEALDRYNEIILASGWRLDNYRRNPVFQNAHQYGDIIFTLGKALITEVRTLPSTINQQPSTSLYQRIQFATDVNPMARIAYGLYRGGFLNAVSVGFIPIRWENGTSADGYRRKYLEQELLEVSAVGIPANPEALQLGLRSGAIHASDLRELLDLLRSTLDGSSAGRDTKFSPSHSANNEAVSNTHAGASGVRGDEARLMRLVREIGEVMRGT